MSESEKNQEYLNDLIRDMARSMDSLRFLKIAHDIKDVVAEGKADFCAQNDISGDQFDALQSIVGDPMHWVPTRRHHW